MATDVWARGIIDEFKKYDIQTIEIKPNDVILLHISPDLDLDSCETIFKEVKSQFPNNTILIVNKYILEGISVLRNENTKISLIDDPVDVDKIFDEIMKGQPNDFLH